MWYVTSPFATGSGASWSSPTSLDNALASAAPNDEIRVKEGTYVPALGSPDPRTGTYLIDRAIILRGGYLGNETTYKPLGSPLNTILTGEIGTSSAEDNLYHVVTIDAPASAKVRVDGFQIERGMASPPSLPPQPGDSRARGAGVYVAAGSTAYLSRLRFTENYTRGEGAAVYCGSSWVSLRQITFFSNVAKDGARGSAIFANRTDLRIANVVFNLNGNLGSTGAMHLKNGAALVANCVFFYNAAADLAGTGGALYAEGGNDSTLWNCSFLDNYAYAGPGHAWTIDTAGLTTGSCRLNNCIVSCGSVAPANGATTFAFGNGTVASSCYLQANTGSVPPSPSTGYANFSSPDPVGWVSGNDNLSLDPALQHVNYQARESLPVDFADVDGDGDVFELLPWDREGNPRVPASGFLQIGAYAARYTQLQVP